jgi:hypothetical protein
VISTSSYLGISGTITNPNIFGVLYGTGSPGTYAEGSLSTNAGFSTPVMLPNEEGYYPYWGFKIPNVVETSADGTTWSVVNPTAYRSLFAFQNGSQINVTTRFLRITHYQPLFTFLGLVSARFVGGTNNKPITMKTELLNADFTTVNSSFGPTTGVVGFDGAALMQKFNSYNGSTRATRVTFDMALWSAGDTYQIGSLMAYMSKPGTGFGFQNKFPMVWDTNRTATFQPSTPSGKGLIVKAATTLTSTITGATGNGTAITYTTSAQHEFLVGQVLTITGIVSTGNPSGTANTGFNINAATVASVISQTQFTVTSAVTDTYTSGGSATVSQGANLQEWQNAAGTSVARVEPAGNLIISGIGVTSGDHRVGTSTYFSAALNVLARATTEKGLVVRGQASQTASMFELQNSAGSITANFTAPVNNVNRLNLGGTDLSATLGITVHASGGIGQLIRGAASQSVPYFQIQNSGSTPVFTVDSSNSLVVQYGSITTGASSGLGQLTSVASSSTTVGAVIRGATGQTANLLEARDSSNNAVAWVTSAGTFTSSQSTGFSIIGATYYGSLNSGQTARIQAGGSVGTNPHVVVRQVSGATGDLQQWQNSGGTVIADISADGALFINNQTTSSDSLLVQRAGSTHFRVDPFNNTFAAGTFTVGANSTAGSIQAGIYSSSATNKGLIIRGAASQSANLQEWQNSAGTVLASVNSAGDIGTSAAMLAGTSSWFSATSNIKTLNAGIIGQVIRATSSQTADLLQLQNSAGTVLASFTTSGSLSIAGTNASIILGGNPGTSGQVLTSSGAGSTPTWTTVSGGSFTGGTLTGNLTLAAGTTSLSPLTFQSGTNLTTVTAGANEYDGTVYYQTSNITPGRALKTQNYYYISNSDFFIDFSESGAVQSMIGGPTTGITVAAGTTYEYEIELAVQHDFVVTSGVQGTFQIVNTTVSGSPTVAVTSYVDYGSNTTSFVTATTMSTVRTTGNVAFMTPISSGSRYGILRAKGIIRVTGTGTTKIYPGLSASATNDNTWIVQSGLIFNLTPIGNGTVTTVGTWT